MGGEQLFAVRRRRLVDRTRILGRREIADVIFQPAIALFETGAGQRADAECGRCDDCVDGLGLAAGMEQPAVAVGDAPQRREVGIADAVVSRRLGQHELGQIERIVAAGRPSGLLIHPSQLPFGEVQGGARSGNKDERIKRPIGPIEFELQS